MKNGGWIKPVTFYMGPLPNRRTWFIDSHPHENNTTLYSFPSSLLQRGDEQPQRKKLKTRGAPKRSSVARTGKTGKERADIVFCTNPDTPMVEMRKRIKRTSGVADTVRICLDEAETEYKKFVPSGRKTREKTEVDRPDVILMRRIWKTGMGSTSADVVSSSTSEQTDRELAKYAATLFSNSKLSRTLQSIADVSL